MASNSKQLAELKRMIGKKPFLSITAAEWNDIAQNLNLLGPPFRSVPQWKKVSIK